MQTDIDDRPRGADGLPLRDDHGVTCRTCQSPVPTFNASARCSTCIAIAKAEVVDLGSWARRASVARTLLAEAERRVARMDRLFDRVARRRSAALEARALARQVLTDVEAEVVSG